jgi:hypothetical protein
MMEEKRTLATLKEIKRVVFECEACHSVMAFEPEHWNRVPLQCQNCPAMWIAPTADEEKAMEQIRQGILTLRKSTNMKCQFKFEFLSSL